MKLHDDSVKGIMENANFYLMHGIGNVYIPGSRVPIYFKHRTTYASITVQLPPPSHLSQFVFCIVLHPFSSEKYHLQIIYECYLAHDTMDVFSNWIDVCEEREEQNSDHVFIWRDAQCRDQLLRKYEESCGNMKKAEEMINAPLVTQNVNLVFTKKNICKFRFYVVGFNDTKEDMRQMYSLIKECGVCPIYTSTYHNSIQPTSFESSNEKEAAPGIQKPISHEFIFLPPHVGTWKDKTKGLKGIIFIFH